MNPGVGQPPAPAAGLTGVSFTVNTFDPQIEEASYELKQRFCIDENVTDRTSSWIYDLQVLRVATVCSVLVVRYTQETRTSEGDFDKKVQRLRQKLDDVLARVQVRLGAVRQLRRAIYSLQLQALPLNLSGFRPWSTVRRWAPAPSAFVGILHRPVITPSGADVRNSEQPTTDNEQRTRKSWQPCKVRFRSA